MKYADDNRIVLTLDAGGTNFVFSAIQANKEIVEPLTLPSSANNLDLCLKTIVNGFKGIVKKIPGKPVAISFGFPGPADYPRGIIGEPINFPAFRGGIALGPMLKEEFGTPVFINNDADLYAYGETIIGFLPYVNTLLKKKGNPKRYNNLLGLTLGTGFGGGIVHNGKIFIGDNAVAGEICLLRNKLNPTTLAEEGVSIRAIRRVYAKKSGIGFKNTPDPKRIYEIATKKEKGDRNAAIDAFKEMGKVLGDAIANALTLIDGLVVIGGGLSAAHSLFLPEVMKELNGKFKVPGGGTLERLRLKAFNLENRKELNEFLKGKLKKIKVPGTSKETSYDPLKRIGVGISSIGTSRATSVGAYAFALSKLDKEI